MDLEITPELEKAVREASSPAEITTAVQAALARKTADDAAVKATEDKVAADKLAADAAASGTGAKFERTENIGGHVFTFEADSQAEVDQLALNAYRVAYAVTEVREENQAEEIHQVVDVAAQQAAAAAEVAKQTELQLKFQRGEMSVKEYLEQSGAVSEFLAKEGISIETLKETVSKSQAVEFEQSWEQAVKEFLQGSNWPGGNANLSVMQNTLIALGLQDSTDKVGALNQAYEYMQRQGTIFAPEVAKSADAPANTTTTQDSAASAAGATMSQTEIDKLIAAAVAKAVADATVAFEASKTPARSSSLFNASSGVSGSPVGVTEAKIRSDLNVTAALKDATPQEILEAWKVAQVAGGKDPNTSFMEQFSGKR